MTNGIDLSQSGWENPEGWKPRERTEQAQPIPPACDAEGPDGWICDLKPNHGGTVHRADGGPEWPRDARFASAPEPVAANERSRMAMDVTPYPGEGRAIIDDSATALTPLDEWAIVAAIREVAREAIADPMPAQWAMALGKIVEMTRGH